MHIIIIGNGITGVSAARFIRKNSDHRITMISGESDHHYARTALMYIYMGHMRYEDTKPYEDFFWGKNRIDLVRGFVQSIDTDNRRVHLADGESLPYDRLLLATGSRPNRAGWEGERLPGVQGLYGLEDLQRMERDTKKVSSAAVVGGGLIGVEMAEMLRTREIPVTFLVRESHYMSQVLPPEEGDLVGEEIRRHGVDLRLSTQLDRIEAGDDGRAAAVVTDQGDRIAAGFVGLAIGVHPNLDLARDTPIEIDRGFLVDRHFRTNVDGVFAAGDCAQLRDPPDGRKAVEQLWYTGRHHGKAVGLTLAGQETPYEPPVFFNSAKFFDLEYQTYGTVQPDGARSILAAEGGRLLRIACDDEGTVTGFNALGVRLRQAVCAHWLRAAAPVGEVIPAFDRAVFDGEFSRSMKGALERAATSGAAA